MHIEIKKKKNAYRDKENRKMHIEIKFIIILLLAYYFSFPLFFISLLLFVYFVSSFLFFFISLLFFISLFLNAGRSTGGLQEKEATVVYQLEFSQLRRCLFTAAGVEGGWQGQNAGPKKESILYMHIINTKKNAGPTKSQ